MSRTLARVAAVLLVALVAACASTRPDDGTIREAALTATVRGDRGTPLIFIPGLSSGAWAWQEMADRYAKDHVVYVVTLAGFDGTPAAGARPFAAAEASVLALMDHRKIVKPVLIGHSLGGTMALHLAATHPDRFAGVVSVDGLPVFPGSETLPADQRAAYAARVQGSLPRDPAVFATSQNAFMASAGGVIDPATGQRLAAQSARSDPGSVAAYLGDILTADFRPELARIRVPVLLVVPYYAPDYAKRPFPYNAADKLIEYRTLMAGTPDLTVVPIAPSRHFAMFDQPEKLRQAIDAFLAKRR